MIRTTITPSESNITIAVPKKYIGKKIEVLMFDLEEVASETSIKINNTKPSQLRGFLTNETAEALHQNIEQSRKEWDTL